MNRHVKEYFHQFSSDEPLSHHFHSVIALHEAPDVSWQVLKEKIPCLDRGWYELSLLSVKDRIEFTRDFWLSKLPYRPGLSEFLERFFSSLEDIDVIITQKTFDAPHEQQLVYILKDDKGFFCGAPSISEEKLQTLRKLFVNDMLPLDYIAFLQIHNGFHKTTDSTGIIPSTKVEVSYLELQKLIERMEPLKTSKGKSVDPKSLIPFYESFGLPFYQCFWAEWYPEGEMGNIYYSGETNIISDLEDLKNDESMAFPTFTDWLMFYLDCVE